MTINKDYSNIVYKNSIFMPFANIWNDWIQKQNVNWIDDSLYLNYPEWMKHKIAYSSLMFGCKLTTK